MGGGDSKEEVNVQNSSKNKNSKQSKKGSKASPRVQGKEDDFNRKNHKASIDMYEDVDKQRDSKDIDPSYRKYMDGMVQNLTNKNGNEQNDQSQNGYPSYDKIAMNESQVQIASNNFGNWEDMFHENGLLNLSISVWNLQATYQCKNINKQYSEYQATITWDYQYKKIKNKRIPFLRFILEESDGYLLSFLVDDNNKCLQGDQQVWNVICPLRNKQEISKVGPYICQRFYKSNKQTLDEQEQELDPQIFYRWEQKPPSNRSAIRKLIRQRRIIEQMKSLDGFQYSQINKYYSQSQEWRHTMMIEQKNNGLKSWLIGLAQNQNSGKNIQDFSVTLKNDIQTREKMYIEQMRKKRDIFRAENAQKR